MEKEEEGKGTYQITKLVNLIIKNASLGARQIVICLGKQHKSDSL